MSVAKAELIELEVDLDEHVRELPAVTMRPVRALLTALFVLINGQLNRVHDVSAAQRGLAAATRLSYLVDGLIDEMAVEPFGADATDCLEGYHEVDHDASQLRLLLNYGHFSEVMPEVHRDYYAVSGDRAVGFKLQHASPEFAEHEARDILLTEFGGPFGFNAPPEIDQRFDALAATAPAYGADLILLQDQLYAFYEQALVEPALLTDAGMVVAAGLTNDEFVRFRAAVYTVGDICRGLARALWRRVEAGTADEAVEKELVEWVSVNWRADYLVGVLVKLSRLEAARVEDVLNIYTLDLRPDSKCTAHAGDGFLPPLVRLADSFIFNGDLIRLFMLARNLLFVLNRVDRRRFDKLVSQEMEPQLIEQAEAVLARLPGIEIVRNHDWNDGEIDLLVYSPTENIALHVQVKAAIPPQGARMVQAIESRAREGLKQLARFGELEATRRDEVLSDALGHDVRDVAVMDVLLSRTSFGTSALWRDAGAVAFVNLLLLAEIVAGADAKAPLADFDVRASTRLDEIVSLAKPKWVEREIDLDVVKLRLPILEYEFEALARSRADAWQRVGVLP
jgi:hypothetical protein